MDNGIIKINKLEVNLNKGLLMLKNQLLQPMRMSVEYLKEGCPLMKFIEYKKLVKLVYN